MKNLLITKGRLLAGSIFLSIMIFSGSCSKDNTNTPDTVSNNVTISGMAFKPATLNVTTGSTVTWTNNDSVVHNVTSDAGLFSSGSLNPGATFSYTFAAAGTFTYKCTIHQGMTGSVVVTAPTSMPGY